MGRGRTRKKKARDSSSRLSLLFLFHSGKRRGHVDDLDGPVERRQVQLGAHLDDAGDLGDDGAVGILEPAGVEVFFFFF